MGDKGRWKRKPLILIITQSSQVQPWLVPGDTRVKSKMYFTALLEVAYHGILLRDIINPSGESRFVRGPVATYQCMIIFSSQL